MNIGFFSPTFFANALLITCLALLAQPLSAEKTGSLISEAQFYSENQYKVVPNGFIKGTKLWTDRKYSLTKIPEELAGATLIQTPMEDRSNRNKVLISFVAQEDCKVYVGIKEGRNPPTWATLWEKTNLVARASNTLVYYRKAFTTGETVTLGDAPGLQAMYSVAVIKNDKPDLGRRDKDGWVNLLQDDSFELWEKGPSKATSQEIGSRWSIKDGVIHLDRDAEKGGGGQIWTKKSYYDFELKFEFNIAYDGNSGIKYRAINDDGRALGCEYQIIDDDNYRDNKNPTHRTACLYELVAVPADRKWNPAGQWNTGRIRVSNNTFEHWLNGEKVVSIKFGSNDWKKRFEESKYRVSPDFAKVAGPIVLTDHGDTVSYRNLFIRELVPQPAKKEKAKSAAKPKKKAAKNEETVLTEPVSYTTNCKACHILDQALVGPSLVEMAELYPEEKRQEFIQWCLTPGRKREHLPLMPSMAHIPEDQLNDIYDYIQKVTVGVQRVRSARTDLYANAPTTIMRPRIVRTFVPDASPASLILALPTSKKHNLIWDTKQCNLRYITVGEPDNYPYLRSNGNSLAKVGDIVYREENSIFTADDIHYKGYSLDQEGYPSFLYQIGESEVTESISVAQDKIVRNFKATPNLPSLQLPEQGSERLKVTVSQSDNAITVTYSAQ